MSDPEAQAAADQSTYVLAQMVATSRALASERDIGKLLAVILESCRQVTGADAGSVYVIEDEDESGVAVPKRLRFMLSQNDSIKIDFKAFTLPVDDKSIVGQAALSGQPINISDLGRAPEVGRTPTFRHNRSFDDKTGYRARSMLTVPMLSAMGEVIGVIQLINKKREPGKPLALAHFDRDVMPFDQRAEELAAAWAAQAGMSLENALLYEEIRRLFDGFVNASVTGDRVARSDHLRPLAAGRDADARSGQEGRRHLRRARSPPRSSTTTGCSRSSTRPCCTTSARSACASRCWSRPRSSTKRTAGRSACASRTSRRRWRSSTPSASCGWRWSWRRTICRGASPRSTASWAPDGRGRRGLGLRRPAPTSRPCSTRGASSGWWRSRASSTWRSDGELRPYLERDEVAALQVRRGSLTDVERVEIESHVKHTSSSCADPLGQALRRRAAHRGRPPRVPERHRLPASPRRAGDPHRVAHHDHRRHLRRAHRLGPPLQEGRPRRPGARGSSSPR